jgi:hypothetical protein
MTKIRSRVLGRRISAALGAAAIVVGGLAATATPASSTVASECDAFAGNVVTNCGFETGDATGWSLSGGFIGVTNNPHSGSFAAFAGTVGSDGSISQTLTTAAPNTTYNLSFWLTNGGGTPNDFSVQVSNVVGGTQTFASMTNSGPFPYTQFGPFQFTTTAGAPTLTFFLRDDPSFWFLDDIAVSTCTQTVSGTVRSVTVTNGKTCISNATVNGAVKVKPGANVAITNSTITGSISARKPSGFTLCGSDVGGLVRVSGATGFVLIGDPGDDVCAGNSITGSIVLTHNTAGLELSHNPKIGGSVTLKSNSGSGPFLPDDANPEVEANVIGLNLTCTSNSAVTNDSQPNTVGGNSVGQCAGL